MKALALRVFLFGFLACASFSCNKEDPGIEGLILGLWTLNEKTVDNQPVTLTDCELQNTIEFQVNNFCLLYDSCTGTTIHSGWNYKYDMLNISEHLPAAYYIDQLDDTALKIRRKDITMTGGLEITVLTYLRQEDD